MRTRGRKKCNISYKIDFNRVWSNLISAVVSTFYSASLNKYCSIVRYSCGSISIIKSIEAVFPGDYLISIGENYRGTDYTLGTRLFLSQVRPRQIFCDIYNPQINKLQYAKARGCYSYIIYKIKDTALVAVKLPTNKIFFLRDSCIVTLGRVAGK